MLDAVDGIMKYIDDQHAKQDIKCPHCGSKLDMDDRHHLVTYWGEDGWKKVTCDNCAKEFEVEETVLRTYETRKIGEEEKEG